ncbi:ABC transporter ATP-binding protein [Paenibacillus sp. MBLB4367]|uniref:ABC transporter ATP-binding protein n=1 Tax=Paenibacillus sp. MBLB4367 TaxID=3384767 RepID=UPI003908451D
MNTKDHKQNSSFALTLRNIWKMTRIIWEERPFVATFWSLILLLSTGVPSLQIWLQKLMIDSINVMNQNESILLKVILLVSATYLLNLLMMIINVFETFLVSLINLDVNYRLKRAIIEKSLELPLTYFDQSSFYDRVQLALESVNRNGVEIVQNVFNLVRIIISIGSIFLILTYTHWTLPVVLVFSAVPGVVLLLIFKKNKYRKTVETTPLGREMDYTFRLLVRRDSAKEIRIFNLGKHLLEKWRDLFFQVRHIQLRQSIVEGVIGATGNLFLTIASLSVALVLVWQINAGKLTLGDYVALTGAVITVQGFIGSFGMTLGQIYEKSLYLNNLDHFLNKIEVKIENGGESPFPKGNYSKIYINNLTFSYPGQDRIILDNISLEIKKGERIAIVGENGAGKTTFVNCLLGLYPTNLGQIVIGDTALNNIDKKSYREHVVVVFQDFVKYLYGIRENVGFGNVSELNNDMKIYSSLEKAGLKDALSFFKNGIDTNLGLELKGGHELSGGQWQRMAIARAFMREADIVILDEPTSSLDPLAELDIFSRFLELSTGRTTIMVSHRLGPARLADKILVLKNGKLIEKGNHDELMGIHGEYRNMFQSQAEWYQAK